MHFKAGLSNLFQYKNKLFCLSTVNLFFPFLVVLYGQVQKVIQVLIEVVVYKTF